MIETKEGSKEIRKYFKYRLFLFNLSLDKMREKDFSFVEPELFYSFKESKYQEISQIIYPVL